MNTLKFILDYKCYPIWFYDENNNFIDNDLPKNLLADNYLDQQLIEIQKIYDSLFTDTKQNFHANSFRSEEERIYFLNKIFQCLDYLNQKYGSEYNILCSYTKDSFKD